jgi:hypothetical protein
MEALQLEYLPNQYFLPFGGVFRLSGNSAIRYPPNQYSYLFCEEVFDYK